TFPLAGTRRRGRTPAEDQAMAKELQTNKKELAEHNMLVDLGRNDLGKVSKIGTVHLEKYLQIQYFSQVMHLGSTIKSQLSPDHDAIDVV
ncbi:chorismate-binding protein, partial [Roseburia faecis]|nr:chorismate-binding protein [Roseburia faecis]